MTLRLDSWDSTGVGSGRVEGRVGCVRFHRDTSGAGGHLREQVRELIANSGRGQG